MAQKQYLVALSIDVADEGDVGLVKVLTQDQLDKVKSIRTGFGNIPGDTYPFDEISDAKEITDEEVAVLRKFRLTDLRFGYCSLSTEPIDDSEIDDDDY